MYIYTHQYWRPFTNYLSLKFNIGETTCINYNTCVHSSDVNLFVSKLDAAQAEYFKFMLNFNNTGIQ